MNCSESNDLLATFGTNSNLGNVIQQINLNDSQIETIIAIECDDSNKSLEKEKEKENTQMLSIKRTENKTKKSVSPVSKMIDRMKAPNLEKSERGNLNDTIIGFKINKNKENENINPDKNDKNAEVPQLPQ